MISFDTILDRLKLHRTASSALLASHRLMAPVRDWYVLMVVFLATVICVLGLGAYLFLGVNRGELLFANRTGSAVAIDTIDRSALRETLLYFEGQASEFATLRADAPTVPSPR